VPVITGLVVVKVSLRLITYQHVPPPSLDFDDSYERSTKSNGT